MADQDSLDHLLHQDVLEGLLPRLGAEQWLPLYVKGDDDPGGMTLWCALLKDEAVERALSHDSWDLSIGAGGPGICTSNISGETVSTYYRYGEGNRIRPFIFYRSFYGAYPQYLELEEEFRLFHNLASDHNRQVLLDFDESGREIEVVRITEERVSVRLKYMRQYQAATQQHLAVYFDSTRYSSIPIAEVSGKSKSKADDKYRWTMSVCDCDFRKDYESFSRLLGKVIFAPPSEKKSGAWPSEDEKTGEEVSFIIGVDSEGENIEHTSNPDRLSDYFGGNPGAPHYLTPVFFRREVLSKYFSEPERYAVTDGQLSCLNLWACRIDNDLKSNVVVFLGDLGRDLPNSERLHWKQFNVAPEGSISETKFRRGFLAEFTNPKSPELLFKAEYRSFCQDWESKFDWKFFLSPTSGDSHLLNTMRVPASNSQPEFDDQILTLTKLLIDFLNEKRLAQETKTDTSQMKGISKLDAFLCESGVDAQSFIIPFLRALQNLRSSGAGHRKGSGYEKALRKLGIDLADKPNAVANLLERGHQTLRILRNHFLE